MVSVKDRIGNAYRNNDLTAFSFALKKLLCAPRRREEKSSPLSLASITHWNFVTLSPGRACPFREFLTGAVILRVRVPEEMALIFPTVDSGWSHETCFPFYFSTLAAPSRRHPRSPRRTQIDKDARTGCIVSSPRSAEIAADVVVKFQCRESPNCCRGTRRAAPLTFLSPPSLPFPPRSPANPLPHLLVRRRLYVAGIPAEKYLCNIARNPAADSSFVDPSAPACGSSFACVRPRVGKRKQETDSSRILELTVREMGKKNAKREL